MSDRIGHARCRRRQACLDQLMEVTSAMSRLSRTLMHAERIRALLERELSNPSKGHLRLMRLKALQLAVQRRLAALIAPAGPALRPIPVRSR